MTNKQLSRPLRPELWGADVTASRASALQLLSRSAVKLTLPLLLCTSIAAEAALVRGAGRGSNTIVTNGSFAGTVPFLVADPNVDDNDIEVTSVRPSDIENAAAYGFGPIGFQANVSHDWGRDCAVLTECSLQIEESEILNWQAHIIGLPELLNVGSYDAVADIRITWQLQAYTPPPVGLLGGFPTPRDLGPDFIWSALFSAANDGSYAPGVGSPSVMLGESLGYLPATDEFSGCFSPFPSSGLPGVAPPLALNESYAFNDCRRAGLDLSQEVGAPTGADLHALLNPDEYLGLFVRIDLIAPEDYQFAAVRELGGIEPIDAIMPGAVGLPTPDSLRSADDLEYRGCAGIAASPCDLFVTTSQILRIDVIPDRLVATEVPAPASLGLVLLGLLGLRRRVR